LGLGCGRGIGATFLAIFCKAVISIDNQKENIAEAIRMNQRENVTYFCEDARTFSFEQKFNVVVLLDVIEHMSQNDAGKVLMNVKNLLSDGGFAVIL
jgi:2-polyprenyl-3-methyl-5-hydroxy-6-metoxy-1,4-benzoquinol methylase